jgi:hypothetical protein
MIYYNLNPNDTKRGDNISVSLVINNEGIGKEVSYNIKGDIIKELANTTIEKDFAIYGQDPLSEENKNFTLEIVKAVKMAFPNRKIYLWTKQTAENLLINLDDVVLSILEKVDVVIDNSFGVKIKDSGLKLREDETQNIYRKQENGKFIIDNN